MKRPYLVPPAQGPVGDGPTPDPDAAAHHLESAVEDDRLSDRVDDHSDDESDELPRAARD